MTHKGKYKGGEREGVWVSVRRERERERGCREGVWVWVRGASVSDERGFLVAVNDRQAI